MNKDSEHGSFGKLEEHDHIRITLHDGTVIEGKAKGVHVGGTYIGRFFVDWTTIRWLRVLSRPTAEEKFTSQVADQISLMLANLTGTRVDESLGTIATQVIRLVRDHDAKEHEVTSVSEGPRRALSTPVVFEEAPVYAMDSGRPPESIDHGTHTHPAPVTAQVEAKPVHQDRLSTR